MRAPDHLCPVVHVHENHDSGSGAQCLPLAGTEPFLRLTSNLPTPNPSHTLSPALAAVFAAFAACLLTPLVRLVQVHILATLAAALRDFYFAYENDPGGYGHLRFELRA